MGLGLFIWFEGALPVGFEGVLFYCLCLTCFWSLLLELLVLMWLVLGLLSCASLGYVVGVYGLLLVC